MMKKNDLRNIGITSEGHIIDLHVKPFKQTVRKL